MTWIYPSHNLLINTTAQSILEINILLQRGAGRKFRATLIYRPAVPARRDFFPLTVNIVMATLTKKQSLFVHGKLNGLSNKQAVIEAGYSYNGAKQAGTRLMSHPGVRSVLQSCGFDISENIQTSKQRITRNMNRALSGLSFAYQGMPKENYSDAKEFLFDGMNNHQLPLIVRAAFAASLLPYHHRKMGR